MSRQRSRQGGDVAAYVARGVSSAGIRFQARVTVHAPAAVVAARINPAVGVVEAIDDHSCLLATGADSVETVAVYLGLPDADFTVSEPPELAERLRKQADRYQRACATATARPRRTPILPGRAETPQPARSQAKQQRTLTEVRTFP